jgi:hypothetical protein
MNRRMRRWSNDPYIVGFAVFFISLILFMFLPESLLSYMLLAVWMLSIFMIGWNMGRKAKERTQREGFFF